MYIIKGNPTLTGKITIEDLTLVSAYLLGTKTLTGDAFTAADVNNDGVVDIVDLSNIKFHILGQKMITEVVRK